MARHLGTFAHGILAAYPQPDFLFAARDDRTDEGLFERLRDGPGYYMSAQRPPMRHSW